MALVGTQVPVTLEQRACLPSGNRQLSHGKKQHIGRASRARLRLAFFPRRLAVPQTESRRKRAFRFPSPPDCIGVKLLGSSRRGNGIPPPASFMQYGDSTCVSPQSLILSNPAWFSASRRPPGPSSRRKSAICACAAGVGCGRVRPVGTRVPATLVPRAFLPRENAQIFQPRRSTHDGARPRARLRLAFFAWRLGVPPSERHRMRAFPFSRRWNRTKKRTKECR